jgi:putative nucleotidyltransferase with HDIG domain
MCSAAASGSAARTLGAVVTADDAKALARLHLAELPRRWQHVQGVGHRAEHVAETLGLTDGALVAAAWLHDIGYSPSLADTGFHQLDGARFLRRIGASDRLARLVAHHSCAVYEARVRGFEQELLTEFDPEESLTYDALVFCDMITGPDGRDIAIDDRIREVYERYGEGDISRALRMAEPHLRAVVDRVSQAMNASCRPLR